MARTHNEIYQEWLRSNPTTRWRDHWQRRVEEQLIDYQKLRWELIPVIHREKMPERSANWKSERFSYDVVRWHAIHGGNVAVNAGESGIIVLDYDSKAMGPYLINRYLQMPVIDTAKGYAFITCPPLDGPLFDKLKAAYPDFDSPRGEGKYELVPLSETCANPKHGTKEETCPPHDFRVREWLGDGLKLPIPTFAQFVTEVLP